MTRILVIEDEPQMLLGLRDNLELEGYEVVTASDGEDGLALERLARTEPEGLHFPSEGSFRHARPGGTPENS